MRGFFIAQEEMEEEKKELAVVDLRQVDRLVYELQDALGRKNLTLLRTIAADSRVWAALIKHPLFQELMDAIVVMAAFGRLEVPPEQFKAIKMLAYRCGLLKLADGKRTISARKIIINPPKTVEFKKLDGTPLDPAKEAFRTTPWVDASDAPALPPSLTA